MANIVCKNCFLFQVDVKKYCAETVVKGTSIWSLLTDGVIPDQLAIPLNKLPCSGDFFVEAGEGPEGRVGPEGGAGPEVGGGPEGLVGGGPAGLAGGAGLEGGGAGRAGGGPDGRSGFSAGGAAGLAGGGPGLGGGGAGLGGGGFKGGTSSSLPIDGMIISEKI